MIPLLIALSSLSLAAAPCDEPTVRVRSSQAVEADGWATVLAFSVCFPEAYGEVDIQFMDVLVDPEIDALIASWGDITSGDGQYLDYYTSYYGSTTGDGLYVYGWYDRRDPDAGIELEGEVKRIRVRADLSDVDLPVWGRVCIHDIEYDSDAGDGLLTGEWCTDLLVRPVG